MTTEKNRLREQAVKGFTGEQDPRFQFNSSQSLDDVSDEFFDRVLTGIAEIHQVPAAFAQWFFYGEDVARRASLCQLRQVEDELNRLWRAAYAPQPLRNQGLTYPERLRLWGNHAEADRVERDLKEMSFNL